MNPQNQPTQQVQNTNQTPIPTQPPVQDLLPRKPKKILLWILISFAVLVVITMAGILYFVANTLQTYQGGVEDQAQTAEYFNNHVDLAAVKDIIHERSSVSCNGRVTGGVKSYSVTATLYTGSSSESELKSLAFDTVSRIMSSIDAAQKIAHSDGCTALYFRLISTAGSEIYASFYYNEDSIAIRSSIERGYYENSDSN